MVAVIDDFPAPYPAAALNRPAILAVFALTYFGIAVGHIPGLKLNRVGIVLLGSIAMLVFGGLSTSEVIASINWPTILLLFGFFVISAQLRLSGFYDVVAGSLAGTLAHPARFLALLMAATAGLSAVVNHDIVCYVFTPIVGAALIRRQLNPVPFLIALAISSNIGSAATLIGNPQDMLIGEVAHLSFGKYLLWSAPPVLFALCCAFAIVWHMSKNHLHIEIAPQPVSAGRTYPFNKPHAIKGLVILAVALGLLFTKIPKEIIALAAAGIHLASPKFKTDELLGLVDWPILVLFMGLFVVTGAFQATGAGVQAARWLAHSGFNLNSPLNLTIATGALSNLLNNAAAVMLLLKEVDLSHVPIPYVLALANSFAGSLLVVGSVANLIVVEQARDLGANISFKDFARLGVPISMAAFAGLLAWILIVN